MNKFFSTIKSSSKDFTGYSGKSVNKYFFKSYALLIMCMAFLVDKGLSQTNYYWNGSNVGAFSNTWNNSGTFWSSPSSQATLNAVWPSASGTYIANFNSAGTASTVTIPGTIAFVPSQINIGTNKYTFATSGASGVINAPIAFGAFGLTLAPQNNTNTLTLGGIISGTGILTNTVGTSILSAANTFSGGTTLTSGQININNAAALGTGRFTIANGTTINNSSAGVIINSNNNLQTWNGNFTFTGTTHSLDLGTGAVTLGASPTITTTANTLTVGGIIGGAFGLTKAGAGTLVLGGNNTYTGVTTINAGTLNIGADLNIGAAPAVATAGSITLAGGTLGTTSTFTMNANRGIALSSGSSLNIATGTTLTYGGVIAGSGLMTLLGTGTLTLSGANTNTGGITLSAATLNINNATALGTGRLTIANGTTINNTSGGAIVNSNNNIQTWNGGYTFTGTNSLDLGTGAVSLGATPTITTSANTLTVGGIIGGAFGLTKAGAGSLTLGGNNTYTGATTINAGTLNVGTDLNLGAVPGGATAGSLTLGGGTLNTTGTFTLSSNRGIALSSGSSVNIAGGTTLSYGGIMAGSGLLTLPGTGTLVLSGTNTNTGGINISTSTLNVGADLNLGAAPGSATAGSLTLGGGTLGTTSSFTLNSNRGIALSSASSLNISGGTTLSYGGIIAGTGLLTLPGTGTLTLSGANTFTGGITLSAGKLNINNASALGVTGRLTLAASTTIDNTSGATVTNSNTNPLTWNGSYTFTGTNSLNLGTGAVTLASNGTITTTANTLTVGGTIATAGFIITKAGAGTLALSGVISGTGGLSTSVGTLTLAGANTFTTGGVALSGGTLNINNATALGGNASVFTVSGTPTIDNTSGGTVTMTATNAKTLNSGFTFTGTNALSLGTGALTLAANGTITTTANTLTIGGTIATAGFILTKAGAGTLALSGVISGTGGISTSAGTLTLSGTNTLTGGVTLSGGTLNINNTSALGGNTSVFTVSGTPTIDNTSGATINMTATNPKTWNSGFIFTGTNALNLGTGAVTLGNNATITTNSATNGLTVSGIIGGAFSLTKSGIGALSLTGANTYSGGITINAGTVSISSDLGLGAAPGVATANKVVLNGGTLAHTATMTVSSNRGIAISAASVDSVTAGTTTYGGILTGSGLLKKQGSGTLVLSGANTNTGGINLTTGTLTINNASALGTGTFTIGTGTTIRNTSGAAIVNSRNNAISIGGSFTFTSTAANTLNLGTGATTLTASPTITTTTSTLTLGGAIGGAFGITKAGTGTLILSGTNTYTGGTTTSSTGTLSIGADANLGAVPGSATAGSLTLGGGTLSTTAGFTLSSNRGIAMSAASTMNVATGTTLAYGGIIAGSGLLTKTGAGILTLSGANTNTGGVTLSAGTLNINNARALGATAGTFTISATSTIDNTSGGAIVNANNNPISVGGNLTFTGTNTLDLGTGAATLTAARTITVTANTLKLGGDLSGAFTLTKSGAGILTLSGTNTHTATTLSAGTLNINSSAALGTGTFTINGTTTIDNTSSGDITNSNNNPITLAASPTYAGTLHNLNLGTGATTLTNARTITVTASTLTLGGNIGGAFRLTKSGAGTLTLSGTNSHSGTTLSAGTLNVNSATALGATAGSFIINGASTLDNTSSGDITNSNNNPISVGASFTYAGTLHNLNLGTGATTLTASRTITVSASNLTLGGVVSGAFALTKAGAGSLTLSNANTYSGGTTLSAGTLNINGATALGAGTFTINGGAIDNTSGGNITNINNNAISLGGSFSFTGSNNLNLGTGNTTLTAARTITTTAKTLTLGGVVSGAFALTKAGAGSLYLTGTNTYSGGTVISGGNLIIGADLNLGAAPGSATAGSLTLSGGTLYDTTGTFSLSSNRGIALTAATSSSIYTAASTTLTYNGIIAGSGTISKTGAGTLTLGGTNTYTGSTTIAAGTLNVAADLNLGAAPGSTTPGSLTLSGGTLATTAGFTLATKRGIALTASTASTINTAPATTLTYGGIIAGSGTITKSGTGSLALSGANTYTGATTISAGSLTLSSSNASDITINSGASLLGTGSTSGAVTVNGTISPIGTGVSTGTFTTGGNMSWNNGGKYTCGVQNSTTSDKLTISGSLTTLSSGTFTIALVGSVALSTNTTWVIGTYGSGTPSATNIVITGSLGNSIGTFSVSFSGGNINLNYVYSLNPIAPTGTSIVTNSYSGLGQRLTASAPSGCVVDWFTGASGGSAVLSGSNTSPANTNVGTYTYYAESRNTTSGLKSTTRTQFTLTITQVPLTITGITGATKVYDGNTSGNSVTGTLSYVGLVNGETFSVTGTVAVTYSQTNVGSGLPVIISGYTAPSANYTVTQPTGIVGSITAKPLTIGSPTISSRPYDGTVAAGLVTVGAITGFVGIETVTATATAADYSSPNAGSYVNDVISYTLNNGANGGLASNYSLANGSATGVITPVALTVTAQPQTVAYGTAVATVTSAGTYSVTGFVNGETSSVISGTASYSTTYTTTTPAGAAGVTIDYLSGLTATNYTFVDGTPGTITVTGVGGTWTGLTNTSYNTGSNWSDGNVPASSSTVTIPSLPTNQPVLGSDITVDSLILNGSLSLNGHTLTVSSNSSGTGYFKGTSSSGLSVGGGTVYFDPSNKDLNTLTIGGTTVLGNALNIYGVLDPSGLSSSDTLYTGGYLTLKSTAETSTAVVGVVGGTIFGNVTVERFIAQGLRTFRDISPEVAGAGSVFTNWQEAGINNNGYGIFITGINGSSPGGVHAPTGFDISLTGAGSMQTYSGGSTSGVWSYPTSTKRLALNPYRGYRLLIRGNRAGSLYTVPQPTAMWSDVKLRATGKLVTGSVSFTVSGTTNGTSDSSYALNNGSTAFSFIGNPYACPIDWTTITKSNISSSYWYLDPTFVNGSGNSIYVTYNATSNTVSNVASNMNQYIQPGQAFFIQNDGSGIDPVLTIDENDKVLPSVASETAIFGNAQPNRIAFNLLKGGGALDGAVAVFRYDFTDAIGDEDSRKFTNTSENLSIMRSGQNLSIEGTSLPKDGDVVQLHLYNLAATTDYQLKVDASLFYSNGVVAYLNDAFLQTQTLIDSSFKTISFTTTADTASFNSRFSLVFGGSSSTLPVNSIVASARISNKTATVSWNTVGEKGVAYFEVEKSKDGKTFHTIAKQTSKNTTSASYAATDNAISSEVNYYRIKAVSMVGSISYSNIVKASVQTIASTVKVYPNPVRGTTFNLQLSNIPAGKYTVELFDALGHQVYSSDVNHGTAEVLSLNMGKHLSAGNYSVKVSGFGQIHQTIMTVAE